MDAPELMVVRLVNEVKSVNPRSFASCAIIGRFRIFKMTLRAGEIKLEDYGYERSIPLADPDLFTKLAEAQQSLPNQP